MECQKPKDLWEISFSQGLVGNFSHTLFSEHFSHCLSSQVIVESMTLSSNICFLNSLGLQLFMHANLWDQRKNIFPRKRIQVTVVLTNYISLLSRITVLYCLFSNARQNKYRVRLETRLDMHKYHPLHILII